GEPNGGELISIHGDRELSLDHIDSLGHIEQGYHPVGGNDRGIGGHRPQVVNTRNLALRHLSGPDRLGVDRKPELGDAAREFEIARDEQPVPENRFCLVTKGTLHSLEHRQEFLTALSVQNLVLKRTDLLSKLLSLSETCTPHHEDEACQPTDLKEHDCSFL